jgi:hypothetical protein
MGSDAPRSVGPVGAIDRTVVSITVMMRIWLANSHSPIGSDTPRSIDSIGTSGGVTGLGEYERAQCNHDSERRCAISGEAQRSVFHFGYRLGSRSASLPHRLLTSKEINAPIELTGFRTTN